MRVAGGGHVAVFVFVWLDFFPGGGGAGGWAGFVFGRVKQASKQVIKRNVCVVGWLWWWWVLPQVLGGFG